MPYNHKVDTGTYDENGKANAMNAAWIGQF